MGAEVDEGLGVLVVMMGVIGFVPVYERSKMDLSRD